MYKKLIRLLIVVFLTIGFLTTSQISVKSQSITGINADISSLRVRINSLESEVRKLNQLNLRSDYSLSSQPQASVSNRNNYGVVNGQVVGSSDPLFERLATLVIELKEDVQNIQKRLTEVEKKSKVSPNKVITDNC